MFPRTALTYIILNREVLNHGRNTNQSKNKITASLQQSGLEVHLSTVETWGAKVRRYNEVQNASQWAERKQKVGWRLGLWKDNSMPNKGKTG